MKRRINLHSQAQIAVKQDIESDEDLDLTPPVTPQPVLYMHSSNRDPLSHSRNRGRDTIYEATDQVTFNENRPAQTTRQNHEPASISIYQDYLQDLKQRTARGSQVQGSQIQGVNQSRVMLQNSIRKASHHSNQNIKGISRVDFNPEILVRYESSSRNENSGSNHSKEQKNHQTPAEARRNNLQRQNVKNLSNKKQIDRFRKSGPKDQNNISPGPSPSSSSESNTSGLKEGSQPTITISHVQQPSRNMIQPNLPRDALLSMGNTIDSPARHERQTSKDSESDSEFPMESERSMQRSSVDRLPVSSYVSPIVPDKRRMQEMNATVSTSSQHGQALYNQQLEQQESYQSYAEESASSVHQQMAMQIQEQHARMKQYGPASTYRTMDGDNQESSRRESVILRKEHGYQVISPQGKMGNVGSARYPYDYGFQHNPLSPKAQIYVEPGQNMHGLGGKLQKQEMNIIPQRTVSQLKQNDDVRSISDNISQSPSPEVKKKYQEKKAQLFHRTLTKEKVWIAGHTKFDPYKYMQENYIKCKKFNYSVPQSYDDLPCVLSVSKDNNYLQLYNIEGAEQKQKYQKLKNPMNKIHFSDVTGFIYGGGGTRFWMLRLGINQRIADNLVQYEVSPGVIGRRLKPGFQLPFYAWECISIQTKERELDLVIQDEYQMKALIQFLIMRLDTMNGKPGSVQVLKDNGILKQSIPTKKMLPRIYNSFFLMKIRMKISFEACTQSKTIIELFLFSILKTYQDRNTKGLIEDPWPKVSKKHLAHLREASMKDIASQGKLEQESIVRQHIRMQKGDDTKEGLQSPVSPDTKDGEDKTDMKMLGLLAGAVLKKDGIDELFGEHLDSDGEDPGDFNLTAKSVKLKDLKQAEKEFKERKEPTEEEKEKDLTQRQRKRFLFKKRMALQDTRTLYTRTLMIVKLRIMQGPMFVYALLQAMQLCKQILALELEQGRECVIPEQLGQKHLPLSFQYYDSILEITRQHISQDQKRFILKLNFNESKIKMRQADQVPVSYQQMVSRYFKKNWRKLKKYQCDEMFQHNLNLYQKSQSVQVARYLQIDKANLRIRHEIGVEEEELLAKLEDDIERRLSLVNNTAPPDSRNEGQQNPKSTPFVLHKSHSQMTSGLVGINQLRQSDKTGTNLPEHDRVQIDFNYITHQGVGRKRAGLYQKKIFYQNQLMSLKEKGRRLLICKKIEEQSLNVLTGILEKEHMLAHGHTHSQVKNCDDEQFNNAKDMLGLSTKKRDATISDTSIKNELDQVMLKIYDFETQTRQYQEGNVVQMRRQLIRDLSRIVPFNDKNYLIDKKIEYDQRFFNDGYAEFQLMICDIRKQVRLNEEILRLRKELERVYDDMHQKEEKTYKDEIKKFKANLKKQVIQTQFTDKMKEMKVLQNEQKENQRVISKLIEHQKYQTKQNNKRSSEVTPAVSEAGLQMKKDGEFYDNFILESEDEESNSQQRASKVVLGSPGKAITKRRDRAISKVSDNDPVQWQGKDESPPLKSQVSGYDQFLKKMKQNSPQSKHKSHPAAVLEDNLKVDTGSVGSIERSVSLQKIRSQSFAIKNILAEFVKRKCSATDESDQKTISRAETIQRKIMKRRSKIKQVSQHSTKSLWGKGGGYEPYDIGVVKDDPKYRSLVRSVKMSQKSVSHTEERKKENNSVSQK